MQQCPFYMYVCVPLHVVIKSACADTESFVKRADGGRTLNTGLVAL